MCHFAAFSLMTSPRSRDRWSIFDPFQVKERVNEFVRVEGLVENSEISRGDHPFAGASFSDFQPFQHISFVPPSMPEVGAYGPLALATARPIHAAAKVGHFYSLNAVGI